MIMVDYCANPQCLKPLHYLREGTVYIFEGTDLEMRSAHKLEHYWLCGDCSLTSRLERTPERELRLVPKHPLRFVRRPAPIAVEPRVTERPLLVSKTA
jgi:hypothetical protein